MRSRLYYIDVARCFACMLVLTSHIFAPICSGFNFTPLPVWWIFNLFDSIIRPAAALYVMISGVLFLGSTRDDSYFTFVRKRYAKLLPPFLVWSLIYALYNAYGQEEPFHLVPTLLKILYSPTAYHLWFMYMILALYLIMPFLKRFIRHARPVHLLLFLAAWMGFLMLRFLRPSFVGDSFLATLLSYGGYAVLGITLAKTDDFQKKTSAWFYLWLGVILFNAAGTYWLTVENGGVLNEKLYFGASPLVAVQAAAMFVLLKNCREDSTFFKNEWVHGAVKHFSRHSYDVYLNHALLITLLANVFPAFDVQHNLGTHIIASVFLTTLVVMPASLGLSMIFSRIPVLSRLLVLSPSTRSDPSPSEQAAVANK